MQRHAAATKKASYAIDLQGDEDLWELAVPHHMDMLVMSLILTPYKAHTRLCAQGIYPSWPWEGANGSMDFDVAR
ncbi:hypothetical protein SUGI_0772780 [Cryptomeria japonica]|nr:hypothetical protein SUGI_0772680 [Cryptomeria japonica]GLJ37963.1 hypothetical protein SUGI_0772780 [Cryptomeria japonica]